MGNMLNFDVFNEDPQDMPGQGLARVDNFRSEQAASEYATLMRHQLTSEQDLGPQFSGARLKALDTTLTGNSETGGISEIYLKALREADPEGAALLDSLTRSATSELALDNELDPNQRRLVEQSTRASQAARGMGFGPSDAFDEQMAKVGYGDQLRESRRNSALTLAKLRQALAGKPLDLATGAYASAPTASSQMFDALNRVYGENQANNRGQAELETKMGMHQADKYADLFSTVGGLASGI